MFDETLIRRVYKTLIGRDACCFIVQCVFKKSVENAQRFRWIVPEPFASADWFLDWRTQFGLLAEANECPDQSVNESATLLDVSTMIVTDLKKALKERGLSQTGNKAALQDRLRSAEPSCPSASKATVITGPNDGLSLATLKQVAASTTVSSSTSTTSSSGTSTACTTMVETSLPPQLGSAILAVHEGYQQTGQLNSARVLIDADGSTVYNAHFVEVNLKRGINRFYVVQLLRHRANYFEVFCHWGKVGMS